MKLSLRTDYALRSMLYLAIHHHELVKSHDIARAYGIPLSHVRQVLFILHNGGFITSKRGRDGGVMLQASPRDITLSSIIAYCEQDTGCLDCMRSEPSPKIRSQQRDPCPLSPECRLKKILFILHETLFEKLSQYTLHDIITPFEIETLKAKAAHISKA